jgi:hypothetical protein
MVTHAANGGFQYMLQATTAESLSNLTRKDARPMDAEIWLSPVESKTTRKQDETRDRNQKS